MSRLVALLVATTLLAGCGEDPYVYEPPRTGNLRIDKLLAESIMSDYCVASVTGGDGPTPAQANDAATRFGQIARQRGDTVSRKENRDLLTPCTAEAVQDLIDAERTRRNLN